MVARRYDCHKIRWHTILTFGVTAFAGDPSRPAKKKEKKKSCSQATNRWRAMVAHWLRPDWPMVLDRGGRAAFSVIGRRQRLTECTEPEISKWHKNQTAPGVKNAVTNPPRAIVSDFIISFFFSSVQRPTKSRSTGQTVYTCFVYRVGVFFLSRLQYPASTHLSLLYKLIA
ncbi:hypothetical protein PgNI_11241, partial [Pyricularia grisea]|uniref:Uncharacterized protein n=1 Tax=Pyricularia grisea TaxID=148305 RepID=A0A6P8AQ20_PYRGI